MRILDSNLWIKETLKSNQTAIDRLEVEKGSTTAVMDKYILAEILAVFDRVLSGRRHDRVLTEFFKRLHTTEGKLRDFSCAVDDELNPNRLNFASSLHEKST